MLKQYGFSTYCIRTGFLVKAWPQKPIWAFARRLDELANEVKVDTEVKWLGFGTVQLFIFEIGSYQVALAGLELII